MALVSMNARIRPLREEASRIRPSFVRALAALSLAGAVSWCVAQAASIPSFTDGGRELVAVEPLLRSLQLGYTIEGSTLDVGGRRFPEALVDHADASYADAAELGRFLHLQVSMRAGLVVFSSPKTVDDGPPAAPAQPDLDAVRTELLGAINAHRGDIGQPPLEFDPIAQSAAQAQADAMALAGRIGHEAAAGRSPMRRYLDLGGRAAWYAENVGWYGLDVQGRDALWSAVEKLDAEMMAERPPDDGHRQNIISPHYQGLGIGVCVGPAGLYLAEDFSGH